MFARKISLILHKKEDIRGAVVCSEGSGLRKLEAALFLPLL